jgi:hemerythrin-like domain-containing protein
MNKTSPLKRNENLVLLSRDHHDGLLTVWKVRQGLKNDTPEHIIAAFILHQYSNHLQPHFLEEEKWLFPTLDGTDELRVKAEHQHEGIRNMVDDIRSFVDDKSISNEVVKVCFEKFANMLEEHIRFEERMLFPHIEQSLSEVELKNIGLQLSIDHNEKKPSPWTDEFWVKQSKSFSS